MRFRISTIRVMAGRYPAATRVLHRRGRALGPAMPHALYTHKGSRERQRDAPVISSCARLAEQCFMAAFDVGDVVAVPSSSYPCYRNLLSTYGCVVVARARFKRSR